MICGSLGELEVHSLRGIPWHISQDLIGPKRFSEKKLFHTKERQKTQKLNWKRVKSFICALKIDLETFCVTNQSSGPRILTYGRLQYGTSMVQHRLLQDLSSQHISEISEIARFSTDNVYNCATIIYACKTASLKLELVHIASVWRCRSCQRRWPMPRITFWNTNYDVVIDLSSLEQNRWLFANLQDLRHARSGNIIKSRSHSRNQF